MTTTLLGERRVIEVGGRAARVFGIRQPDGTNCLTLDPGQPFDVGVTNRGSEATIIQWHRQTPPFPRRAGRGKRVVNEMSNTSPKAHPMHLHGHHFQVIALDGAPMRGARRDTVLVPASGAVTIAFDADNPGRWLLH